jgi:hypothetical protein
MHINLNELPCLFVSLDSLYLVNTWYLHTIPEQVSLTRKDVLSTRIEAG